MDETKDKETDIVKAALDLYERAQEAESDNRERARAAIKFRSLDQWPQDIYNERTKPQKGGSRPCLVIDKINQYLNQVKNDQRQNKPSVKVRPVDDVADPEVAEIFRGIIRHIEDTSSADIAYDTAFSHAVDGGFGYWRIITEYADPMSFNQEIRIVRIPNQFQVYLDPNHQQPDGSDSREALIFEDIEREEFKRQYPDADQSDFEWSDNPDWLTKTHVRVAEYFRLEKQEQKIYLLVTGEVVTELSEGMTAIKERTVMVDKVKWYKLNANEILEESEWAGRYIPVVELIGNEVNIEGKRRLSGMVESAMDQQRMYNYAMSSFVETVALAPKAPWLAAEGQTDGHEDEFELANRANLAVVHYKPTSYDDGSPVPMPQRQTMQGIPAGWLQMMESMEHGIQGAFGMYQASVGQQGNEKSGRAIMARQREGDTATFHYVDNLSRSIRHTGRILVDMIPKIYDTAQIIRILGEDGEPDYAEINPEQEMPMVDRLDPVSGEPVDKIYNLGVGKYDVTVTVGPAYTTKRQEAVEFLSNIVQSNPELMQIAGDIMFRNMDLPGSEEVAKRLKAMLPPPIQALENEEGQPQIPPEIQNRLQQAGMIMEKLSGQLQMAQQALSESQMQLKHKELADESSMRLAEAKIAEAEIKKQTEEIKALASVRTAEIESKADLNIDIDAKLQNMEQAIGAFADIISGIANKPKPKRSVVTKRQPDGSLYSEVIEEAQTIQ